MNRTPRAEGHVWCTEHGTIHEATTDPYGYGEPDCTKSSHRSVLVRLHKADGPL